MGKLIKYELMAKSKRLLIFLAAAVGINIAILIKFTLQPSFDPLKGTATLGLFFTLLFFAFLVLLFIDIVMTYSRDLNNKEGYMFFLTPYSSYKILGAKTLTGVLEGVLFVALYTVMVVMNFFWFYHDLSMAFWQRFWLLFYHLPAPDHPSMILVFFLVLLIMFVFAMLTVLIAYAAITLRRTLLSNMKLGGLISFGIFAALCWFTGWVFDHIGNLLEPFFNVFIETAQDWVFYGNQVVLGLSAFLIVQIIVGVLYFLGVGYLLEKKVDL